MLRKLLSKVKSFFISPMTAADQSDERLGRFTERGSFQYDHPTRNPSIRRFIDPLTAARRLNEYGNGSQWTEAITAFDVANTAIATGVDNLVAKGIVERDRALAELSLLARQVFDLPTVEEYGESLGWTEAEAFLLLTEFIKGANEVGNAALPLLK